MNRKEQISDTAEHFYLNNDNEQNNYDDERLSKAFICGAEWADSNPYNKEEINEEELDKLAEHWCPESGSYREGDIETQRVIRNAYKAGYRKAKNDNN